MIILLSPAKSFDFESLANTNKESNPLFVEESTKLAEKMKSFSAKKIGELMKISFDLSKLNVERFKNWTPTPERENAKQAVLVFNGEAYRGLNVGEWEATDFDFAQEKLRILSGLYGVLRPLGVVNK